MSETSDNDGTETYLDYEYIKNLPPDDDTVCHLCMAEFIDPEDLEVHLRQVHHAFSSKKQSCQFCSMLYADMMSYAIHIRDNHITQLKRCKYCTKAFVDSAAHRKHENKHNKSHNRRFYKCSQCEDTFQSIFELKSHELNQHNNNNDGIVINNILPYLSIALNIKASTFLQYLNNNTVFICVACDFTTDDADLFIEHAQNSNCETYVCGHCSNTYKKKIYLRRHLNKECGHQRIQRIKGRKCTECNVSFNRIEYKTHKKHCRVIKCYICEIMFATMYELSAHQSKEHPLSVEVKTCKFCGKQSVGSVALQKHIDRSHKGEFHMYKYLCIYCNKAYKHPQKLFGHFFTKHKDINPYTCKICNIEFRPRKKFTIHIKLLHDSKGFVEFDKNYHVFFTDKKSEDPFVPTSIYADEDGEIEKEENSADNVHAEKSGNNIKLVDCTSLTETEGNQTEFEAEKIKKKCVKTKKPIRIRKDLKQEAIYVQSSDEEPLLVIKKRTQAKAQTSPMSRNILRKRRRTEFNKKKFTCKICKKYCYTFQNYNHHMSLHSKNDTKKCIICAKTFRSKQKLSDHIANKHSSSKLTDTLKKMIENRKSGNTTTIIEVSAAEKFKKTIKKVDVDNSMITAKIKPVEIGLSVQKFIENFTPEENKTDPGLNTEISIKVVSGIYKKPTIKLSKFDPTPISLTSRLSMPVKFKDCSTEKAHLTVKIVHQPSVTHDVVETDSFMDDFDHNESIPEVAEEIMLEGTEEPPKPIRVPHKIIIDKLPKGYKDIRIAHLLPEAPFYKIIKVQDVLEPKQPGKYVSPNGETIQLPDGTKLVSSNPLAHLLKDTSVEKVLEPGKNKYYKPRTQNFEGILAKALANLDIPTPPKKKKKLNTVEKVGDVIEDNQ